MATSIEELKGLVNTKLGFAMTNNYVVKIPSVPGFNVPGLGGFSGIPLPIPGFQGGQATSREIDLLCKNAEIPGKQILTTDRRIGMVSEKVAYGYAVPDVTLQFYLLNDYGIKRYFDNWKDSILDETTGEIGYKKDYAKDVVIHQLRKPILNKQITAGPINLQLGLGGDFVYSVRLEDAFPTTINTIPLQNDLDVIGELTVTLSYTNVVVEEQSALSGLINLGLGF